MRAPLPSFPLPAPGDLYDRLVRGETVEGIEVVAFPGHAPRREPREGDIYLRRAIGEGRLAYQAVLTAGELRGAQELADEGLWVEHTAPGFYGEVVEPSSPVPARGERIARRVLDGQGRIAADGMLVRPRGASTPAPSRGASEEAWRGFEDAGEAAFDPPREFIGQRFTGDAQLLEILNNTLFMRRTAGSGRVTSGPAVVIVQQALLDLGYVLTAGANGTFDANMESVVKDFQRDQKRFDSDVGVDGIVGPITLGRLDLVFAAMSRPCGGAVTGRRDPTTVAAPPAVGTRDYDLSVTVDGTTLTARGHVRFPNPLPAGRRPIVFLSHGNHDPADPSFRGYVFLQDVLARLGIISVSIDANATNGPVGLSPANIDDRAMLIMASMRHLLTLDTTAADALFQRIDFAHTGLFGHSRGGEAVLLALELLDGIQTGGSADAADFGRIDVRGVVSLAPTDANSVDPIRANDFMFILPARDGDVITNDGAKHYDRAPLRTIKSQLFVERTNHNFYNREWLQDDLLGVRGVPAQWVPTLTRREHERTLEVYCAAFYRHTLLGEPWDTVLTGAERPPGLTCDVRIAAERTGAITVDDHEDRAAGHDRINALGGAITTTGAVTFAEHDFMNGVDVTLPPPLGVVPDDASLRARLGRTPAAFNDSFYGETRGVVIETWTRGAELRHALVPASQDLSGREIWIRAADVYRRDIDPPCPIGFSLGLEDTTGRRAFVSSGELPVPFDRRGADELVRAITGGASVRDRSKTMPSTFRFPADCFRLARSSIDLRHIRAIVLRFDRDEPRPLALDHLQIVTV